MNFLSNINPHEFTISAFIVGYLLIDSFNANEQNSIGNWFMLVGQVLETNAAQLQVVQSNISKNSTDNKQNSDIESLKKAIQMINDKLNSL